MIKILQIVQRITAGGGVTGMITVSEELVKLGSYDQSIISIAEADPVALKIAHKANLRVVNAPNTKGIFDEIRNADIVQINYWNTPDIFELIRKDLPAMRLVIRFNVNGVYPPHIILSEMIEYTDIAVASSSYSYEQDFFQNLPPEIRCRADYL